MVCGENPTDQVPIFNSHLSDYSNSPEETSQSANFTRDCSSYPQTYMNFGTMNDKGTKIAHALENHIFLVSIIQKAILSKSNKIMFLTIDQKTRIPIPKKEVIAFFQTLGNSRVNQYNDPILLTISIPISRFFAQKLRSQDFFSSIQPFLIQVPVQV